MLHQWQCGKKHCTHLPARHSSNMQRQQQRLCKCNCNRSDQQKPTFSPLVLAQCRLSSVSVTSWNARFQSFLTHAFNRHTLSWQSAANVAAASADASAAAAAAATEIVFVVICTRGPGNSQPIVSSRSLVLAIPTLFSAGPFLMAHHRQPSSGRHLWDFDSCCYGRHPDVRLSAIGSLVPQKRQHHQEQQQRHVLGLYSPCLIIVINQYRYSRYPSMGLSSGWLVSLAALC